MRPVLCVNSPRARGVVACLGFSSLETQGRCSDCVCACACGRERDAALVCWPTPPHDVAWCQRRRPSLSVSTVCTYGLTYYVRTQFAPCRNRDVAQRADGRVPRCGRCGLVLFHGLWRGRIDEVAQRLWSRRVRNRGSFLLLGNGACADGPGRLTGGGRDVMTPAVEM